MTQPIHTHVSDDLAAVRSASPLVHNITNYVVMNNTANALLAVGASPVMAHAVEEMADMASIASALVINIGTLSPEWVEGMHAAMRTAAARGIPIILDPVGAGATPYRNQVVMELLGSAKPTIIRGNASEILSVASVWTDSRDDGSADGGPAVGEAGGNDAPPSTKGVDSTHESAAAIEAGSRLSDALGCVTVVSGAVDYIIPPASREADGAAPLRRHILGVANGHPLMTRVTGLGCTATALLGAFAAVQPDAARAAFSTMAVMGVAGELAAEGADGPGTLQLRLLDHLHALDAERIRTRFKASDL